MSLLVSLLWVGLAGWIGLFLWIVRNARGYPMVAAPMDLNPRQRPRVSILIPARNEAKILAVTLPNILAQDYDDYEAILVDDASTDGTGELAERLALSHPGRLRVLRVTELPPGWVGKTHALHQGFEAANGEWVLATDADIVFHPKALRAGLWLAEREQADLVSIYAFLECLSFWEKVLLPGFGLLLSAIFPVRKINNPRSSVALASGGYILMRRSVWAGLGGYAAIRSEMIDDLNTARLVKHSGRRIYVAATRDLVRTRMYSSFRGIWEGLRKNAFAAHRYSVAKMILTASAYFVCNLLPLTCLVFYGWRWAASGVGLIAAERTILLLSLAQYAVSAGMHFPLMVYLRIHPAYALLAPLGAIFYSTISLDSMFRTLFGRGVSWKQRKYANPRGSCGNIENSPSNRKTDGSDTLLGVEESASQINLLKP
ncbi:MAG: glycosyltransferase [Acidobacteria bacterium]|nr:glycosyltransferase [Acidobacteriota bacterium]